MESIVSVSVVLKIDSSGKYTWLGQNSKEKVIILGSKFRGKSQANSERFFPSVYNSTLHFKKRNIVDTRVWFLFLVSRHFPSFLSSHFPPLPPPFPSRQKEKNIRRPFLLLLSFLFCAPILHFSPPFLRGFFWGQEGLNMMGGGTVGRTVPFSKALSYFVLN